MDTGPPENGTVGNTCKTDEDCDPLELGTSRCLSSYSTPICIAIGCGGAGKSCDKGTGVCIGSAPNTFCVPACDFDDSGAAPRGCQGSDRCDPVVWGPTSAGQSTGIGLCISGCRADADCSAGLHCVAETGLCSKTPVTMTKAAGEACVEADNGDAKAPPKCRCKTQGGKGYCAPICVPGETSCPTGFTCDPGLPKAKLRDDSASFTKLPAGILGSCLKDCETDADCAAVGAYCEENAGVGRKTCQVGKRPCATDANCPSGQSCKDATAKEVGSCG